MRSTPEKELEIIRPGPLCLVQDLGRPGLAGQGVTVAGALDRASLTQGNRLLGNTSRAAGLELLLGGLHVRPTASVLLAVTGAWCPITVNGDNVPFGTAVLVPAGATMRLGSPQHGLRSYLTVRGGLAPPGSFAGSCSTDTSSGIGPAPVTSGDRIPVGDDVAGRPLVGAIPPAVPGTEVTLRITLGPRVGSVNAADRRMLTESVGTVSSDSDRIGVRLNGFEISAAGAGRPSEAIPLGAVQVPPSGELIVFLADHPTTGGYPVIGVVDAEDLDHLAQCAPGTSVRFAICPAPVY
jgi:biotin-dependent carboxylase-like uncharacterized protein